MRSRQRRSIRLFSRLSRTARTARASSLDTLLQSRTLLHPSRPLHGNVLLLSVASGTPRFEDFCPNGPCCAPEALSRAPAEELHNTMLRTRRRPVLCRSQSVQTSTGASSEPGLRENSDANQAQCLGKCMRSGRDIPAHSAQFNVCMRTYECWSGNASQHFESSSRPVLALLLKRQGFHRAWTKCLNCELKDLKASAPPPL